MFDDFRESEALDVPVIHNHKELEKLLSNHYVISHYLTDYDRYNAFLKDIMNLLRGCFQIRACREYPVKFKFALKDRKYHTLQLRHFAINLILWLPFVELSDLDVLGEDFIFDCTDDNNYDITSYINYKLIGVLREYHVKSTTVNFSISEVLYNLRRISIDFSLVMGLNFSALTFLDMYEKNNEIKDIMEVRFRPDMQPYEIEQELSELQDREIAIYKSVKDNPIGVMLRSGSGIKHKQFAEFTISEGLKPSLEGVTIPKPIENSTMLRGLDRPSYLYIDAIGARKSLIMNKKVMGRAGYFGKIVLLLCQTLSMSKEVYDCGTKHLVTYDIKSKKHLKKFNGKFYKENDEDTGFKIINSKRDTHLIGKSIKVRSIATCALGDCACPSCVGVTSATNYDLADGISGFESEEVTKVVEQGILSAKHLLSTNSETIEFNPPFYDFFVMLGGEINPLVNENDHVSNVEDWAIYIDPNDIAKVEEMDDDSLYNTFIANGRFFMKNLKDDSIDDIEIKCEDEREIFLTEEALEYMKKGKGYIKFSDLDDDVKLFEMVINFMVTPYREIWKNNLFNCWDVLLG